MEINVFSAFEYDNEINYTNEKEIMQSNIQTYYIAGQLRRDASK